MIYEQNCYNVKYFDNLIEIKNIPNKFIRFKIYENILHFFKLYKCNILIKYYDQEFLIYQKPKSLVVWDGRPDFSFLFKSCEIDRSQGRLVK